MRAALPEGTRSPVSGRAAGALIVGGMAVLAAGCGGGSRPAPTPANAAVAFAQCMRSNGVSKYPDPDNFGHLVKQSLQQLGVQSSQFQSAQSACMHLLPNGGQTQSQSQRQQVRDLSLRFSQCVRAHGVPNFPDPGSDGRIPDPASAGIDQGSPKFETANQACGRYRPPYMPSNSAYNAWARTHSSGS